MSWTRKRRFFVNGAFFCYHHNMTSYKILYDLTQDAYNWYSAIVKFGQKKKLKHPVELEIAEKIQDLDFDQAKEILVPFLKNTKQAEAEKFKGIMEKQLEQYFESAVQKLEQMTGHPLAIKNCAKNRAREIAKVSPEAKSPTEDLLFLITTFPAMIVYYEEGTIYTYAKIDDKLWGMPLDGILHELLHFQTDFYYRQNPDSPVSKLTEEEYYILKESLPVLLDESWQPIITLPDQSYPEFNSLREKLHAFYAENPNFDQLIEYGAKEVQKCAY